MPATTRGPTAITPVPPNTRLTPSAGDHFASPAERILATLWRRRLTFAISFIATLAAVAAVTYSLPKVYSTHSFLLVTPTQETGSQFAAVELTETLAKTYSELLQSPQVADTVSDELPFERSGETLENAVSVSPVSGSQLLQIEAEAGTADEAKVIADTYADVFSERAGTIGGETPPARLTVAEQAFLPRSPTRPKPLLYLLIGTVFASMVATGAALLRERLAQQIEVDSSTTDLFGLPVIGRIPKSRALALALRAPDRLTSSLLTEPFRLLHANISFVAESGRPLTLAVVSAEPGEGKSICAANLGRVSADLEASVLLIDADLRERMLTHEAGANSNRPGLTSLLSEGDHDQRLAANALKRSGTGLRFLAAGPPTANSTALLGSAAFDRLNADAARQFSMVIYDCPPLGVAADASLIASRVDGVLLVVDAERTTRRAALQGIDQLRRAQANILGVVVNRAPGAGRASAYNEPTGPRRLELAESNRSG